MSQRELAGYGLALAFVCVMTAAWGVAGALLAVVAWLAFDAARSWCRSRGRG